MRPALRSLPTILRETGSAPPAFWVEGRGGGKTREIFLYQQIILFTSKKPRSCRNT
ncbi:hypothetical protein [Leptospira borgpetersenii]|uniref:hypothetical protein n=1 Tax=Leptospira borgpetersenii TaxID=174 RepID=UPI0029551B46|nr:hypothetical protein [Leptospira borgpetersenii]